MRSLNQRATDARAFAVTAHGDQKYGDLPYVTHLDEVAEILQGVRPDLLPEAYLHDVLEDTSVTRAEIAALFGEDTASIVEACTGVGRNRRERNASIAAKLLRCPEAIPVKLADRLANMRRSISNPEKARMYAKEYPVFRNALYPTSTECALWEALDAVYEKLCG